MRRIVVIASALALLIIASAVASAIALGPTKAAEVGNNPNVFINPANQKTALNTPRGDKSALDRITWYENQIIIYKNVSNSNGITNNAITADIDTVNGMIANPQDYENKWIYLSGEKDANKYDDPNDSPDVGAHGLFYWWIRLGSGFSHEDALASIEARNPDGGLLNMHYVGS